MLISADSQGAVIEYGDTEHQLDLSSRIATRFEKPKASTVTILLNESGQYKTAGAINGKTVEFLVDTGANVVAMNSNDANRLGIDLSQARPVMVTTASGQTQSLMVVLRIGRGH